MATPSHFGTLNRKSSVANFNRPGGGGLLDIKGIPHEYRGIVLSSLCGYLTGNMFDHVKVRGKFVCWRLLRRAVVSRVGHFGQLREQFLRSQGVGGE